MMKFIKMIILFFPFMLLAGAVYGIFRFAYLRRRGKRGMDGIGELIRLCFVCYIFALCSLVFVPEDFWDKVWLFIKSGGRDFPYFELFGGSYSTRNLFFQCLRGSFRDIIVNKYSVIANIIMFVPLGFFLPLAFKKIKPLHSVFICFAATCFIEAVQPVVCRTGDIDDVIANFLGGALGAAAAGAVLKLRNR